MKCLQPLTFKNQSNCADCWLPTITQGVLTSKGRSPHVYSSSTTNSYRNQGLIECKRIFHNSISMDNGNAFISNNPYPINLNHLVTLNRLSHSIRFWRWGILLWDEKNEPFSINIELKIIKTINWTQQRAN